MISYSYHEDCGRRSPRACCLRYGSGVMVHGCYDVYAAAFKAKAKGVGRSTRHVDGEKGY